MQFLLTREEREIFDHFYTETLSEGTGLFRMPNPTIEQWPILTESGLPLLSEGGSTLEGAATWLCRFGDQVPTETVIGTRFQKNVEVVVLP